MAFGSLPGGYSDLTGFRASLEEAAALRPAMEAVIESPLKKGALVKHEF
jgi:hypothetical protein